MVTANSTITAKRDMLRDNAKLFQDVKKKNAINGTLRCAKDFLFKSFVSLVLNVLMCTWLTQT